MQIKLIKLEHTNPSLGPHEKITTISLTVTEKNLQEVDDFIRSSKINNTTSLFEYLQAIENDDKKMIDSVLNNSPKGVLNEGGNISNLYFHLENGKTIELADVYRQYHLSNFYPEFTSYMVKAGEVIDENISPFEL
ncbi:MAG: hypothetical protein CMO01_30980 [Thalassobius sp.]|nr:hypothetical protein [Thalassovita sp.]